MSNHFAPAVHPETGEVVENAQWLDGYFGPRQWGVMFPQDGRVYREEHLPALPHSDEARKLLEALIRMSEAATRYEQLKAWLEPRIYNRDYQKILAEFSDEDVPVMYGPSFDEVVNSLPDPPLLNRRY